MRLWIAAPTALAAIAPLAATKVPSASAIDLGPRDPEVRLGISFDPDQLHAGVGV